MFGEIESRGFSASVLDEQGSPPVMALPPTAQVLQRQGWPGLSAKRVTPGMHAFEGIHSDRLRKYKVIQLLLKSDGLSCLVENMLYLCQICVYHSFSYVLIKAPPT